MDNKEKITELVDKQEKQLLKSSDKVLLDQLLLDEENKKFYDTLISVRDAVRSGSHLSYEQLYNYILLKNGNEPEDKSIIEQLPQVEKHLRVCNSCQNEFTELNSEYSEIENFIASPPDISAGYTPAVETLPKQKLYAGRVGLYGAIVVFAVYLVLFAVSALVTPENVKLGEIKNASQNFITRGRPTDNFQQGLNALQRKNYDEAAGFLRNDINNSPEDATIFYSHYILGLTYLENSKNYFLGLFLSYDEEKVQSGISELKKAVMMNNSGRYPNVSYDAYFYLAKASLMINNITEGKKYFKLVVDNKGSKMQEAKTILKELE